MAFSGNFMCTSFKKELLFGVHDFDTSASGDTYKLALYTNSASFTAATTAYTTSNEVTGTNYSAGGGTLNSVDPSLPSKVKVGSGEDPSSRASDVVLYGHIVLFISDIKLLYCLLLSIAMQRICDILLC